MARFTVHERVQVTVEGFWEGVTATVESVTEGFGEPSYVIDVDVGGKLLVNESGLAKPGEVKGGTYSYRWD